MSEHDFAPFGLESNPQWQETHGGFDREDPKRFTGHERDYAGEGAPASTAYLDYMHARSFSATVGRFLSVDPLIGDVADPQSFNRYAYVENNPALLTDPYGLFECVGVSGCVDNITVPGDSIPVKGVWGSMGDDKLVQRITARNQPRQPKEDLENEMERIAKIQHCIEGTLAPLLVGGAAIVTGGVVAYSGTVLTEAAVGAAGPSYGITLGLVPVGAAVVAAGGYVVVAGGSIWSNTVNNWLGTKLPSASRSFPRYFPQYPAPNSNPCIEH
jgi:RHS repeat-associated protein